MTIKLEMNDEQAQVIVEALDLFSRALMGQFEEVGHIAAKYSVNSLGAGEYKPGPSSFVDKVPSKQKYEEHHQFIDMLRYAKGILGFSPNSSYGIFNEHIHDNSRVAYDIQQVLRNYLAFKRTPEGGMGVNFDEPFQTGSLKLPVITNEE